MDDEVRKVIKALIVIIIIGFGLKILWGYNPGIYRGHGYTIKFPPGWEEWKRKIKKPKPADSQEEEPKHQPKIVTYVTPERDILTYAPQASMSVLSYKLEQSLWMEDEFPGFVNAIARTGAKIIDQGKVPLSDQNANWVFYHNLADDILGIEFYIITEGNMFYKISYSTTSKYFNRYRPEFEESKNTLKVKTGLF